MNRDKKIREIARVLLETNSYYFELAMEEAEEILNNDKTGDNNENTS